MERRFHPRICGRRRGQSISVDFIISISVFILLLAIVYSVWANNINSLGDTITQNQANEAARRGLDALVRSPGYPTNWAALGLTPDNSSLLGLGAADSDGQLDAFKLASLAALYNNSAYYNDTLLKMGLSPFQADVRVAYLNGTNVTVMGSPPGGASDVVLASAARVANLGNETVTVRVRVWQVTP